MKKIVEIKSKKNMTQLINVGAKNERKNCIIDGLRSPSQSKWKIK